MAKRGGFVVVEGTCPWGLWVRDRGAEPSSGIGTGPRRGVVLPCSHVGHGLTPSVARSVSSYAGSVTVNLPMRSGLTTLAPKRQMQRTAMLSAAK